MNETSWNTTLTFHGLKGRSGTALGASFSYDQEQNDNLNIHEKLVQPVQLEKSLKTWKGRGLTPIGKICVLKMLEISKLLYTCSNLKVPETFPTLPPKVKSSTMIQNTKNGGLKMSDMSLMCKSLKIWTKEFLKLRRFTVEKNSSSLFFLYNYELKKLDLDLPPVYKDMIKTWSKSKQTSPQTSKDIHNEILWNNSD